MYYKPSTTNITNMKLLTPKEIGDILTKHGYVSSMNGYKKYSKKTRTYKTIPDKVVFEIFNKLYVNLELQKVDNHLISKYIPSVSDRAFKKYEYCKDIKNKPAPDYDAKIEKILAENESRKKTISGDITPHTTNKHLQFFINGDFFTDGKRFFKYDDGTFKPVPFNQIKSIITAKLKDSRQGIKYAKLERILVHQLTDISAFPLKEYNRFRNISQGDWETYERINKLIESYS